MGFWTELFGGKSAPVAAPQPLTAEELVRRVQTGATVKLKTALAGTTDEEEEACLWAVLPHSDGQFRVEVIERLAEFELDAEQQKRLLLAAVERVPGTAWTGAAVADGCDLAALAVQAAAATPCDDAVLDAIALIIASQCEAALGQGPRAELFDLATCAETVGAWADALRGAEGGLGDLVALDLAIQVCMMPELHDAGPESADPDQVAGWGPELAERLRDLLTGMLARPPRGATSWPERVRAGVHADRPELAVQALAAARVARIPVRSIVLDRVRAAPDDAGAWSLVGHLQLDTTVLATLAPLAEQALASRRLREGDLCSPASQASCKSCGTGAKAADDDDLMVPKAMEARIQPLLSACAKAPGEHVGLVRECLEAPSPNLRTLAVAVLQQWPADAIPDEIWLVIEGLADDSLPQVRARVAALLARGRQSDDDDDASADDELDDATA